MNVNKINKELFRKAYKASLLGELANNTSIDIMTDDTNINKLLNTYKRIHNILPFPLSNIENDIKYSVIANGVRQQIKGIDIWVNNGICTKYKNNMLRIRQTSYSIQRLSDKTNTSIDDYKGTKYYKEFNWVNEQLKKGNSLKDYYKEFMKDALKNIPKKEFENYLMNALNQEKLTGLQRLTINTVRYKQDTYSIDIYEKTYDTGDTTEDIEIKGTEVISTKRKVINKYYDYTTYIKCENQPIQEIDSIWIGAIFETLVSRYKYYGWLEYKGIVINDKDLIFEVQNTIFKSNFHNYSIPEIIATNASLFGYKDNNVYISQKTKFEGLNHETIYRLDGDDFKVSTERLYR